MECVEVIFSKLRMIENAIELQAYDNFKRKDIKRTNSLMELMN